MRKMGYSIALATLAVGCAAPQVVMVHPTTGDTRQCSASGTGTVSNCVEQMEALGYKRADELKSKERDLAEIRRIAQDDLQRIQTELKNEPTCSSGVFVLPNGRIGWVNYNAERSGVRFGDKIVSYGSLAFSTQEAFKEWVEQYQPGDELSIVVQRKTGIHQVTVNCADRNQRVHTYIRIYEMAATGDWEGCLRKVAETERFEKPHTTLAYARVYCSQGRRFAVGENLTLSEARLAYEAARLAIRQASLSREVLEEIRSGILSDASSLSQWGFPALADDLKAQFDSAVEVSSR